MSLEEKISYLNYDRLPLRRLGVPRLDLEAEGAHGLVDRSGGKASVFPQPLGLSMTWDRALLRQVGSVISDEARAYGKPVLFFPTIDMERDPRWGRNEEAYGEDPFLAGMLSASLIKGVQGDCYPYLKAVATVKHFYANNYELERNWTNSVLPARLQYDYYLRVFFYAFTQGGAASLMTAYNKINGVTGMLNPQLDSLVRDQWGVEGFFVSDGEAYDWLPIEDKAYHGDAEYTAAAIKAGLDCFLLDDVSRKVADGVLEAIDQGLLTQADVDEAVLHQVRVLLRLGLLGGFGENPWAGGIEAGPAAADPRLCRPESSALVRRAALEAVTLLKNDGFLPLRPDRVKKIAVVGQLGVETVPDWYAGNPPYETTPFAAIAREFPTADVAAADACDTVAFYHQGAKAWLRVADDGCVRFDGTTGTRSLFRASDWGYGGFGFRECATKKYLTTTPDGELRADSDTFGDWITRELFFVRDTAENGEVQRRFAAELAGVPDTDESVAAVDRNGCHNEAPIYHKAYSEHGLEAINATLGQLVIEQVTDGIAQAAELAAGADAVVVCLGNNPFVGAREGVDRPDVNLPERWSTMFAAVAKANPHVVLCVIAGYPYAIEDEERVARAVLFTAHGQQEIGTAIAQTLSGANNPAGRLTQTWYTADRVLPDIDDYDIATNKMTYLYNDRPVLHEFGFGLSYSAFAYSGLQVTADGAGTVRVCFTLANVSERDGDEVPQLYFALSTMAPDISGAVPADFVRPVKQLAGFDRLHIRAGVSAQVSFEVSRQELSFYDPASQSFRFYAGDYDFMVGASSSDIRLRQQLHLGV